MICNQPENVPLATEQSVISSSEAIEYLFLNFQWASYCHGFLEWPNPSSAGAG